ncbi:hypothetical protein BC629DRAFT_1672602 [Irpex lacteus]|nr:hypothetical protein BC629DRAFT_1672602 [Irpex lacteus]
MQAISDSTSSDSFQCYQCLKKMKKNEARNHVGIHILNAMRGVIEELPGEPVGSSMPCGFCGRSGIATCRDIYIAKGKRGQATSGCPHAHDFRYKTSLTSTVSTPSTNTPVLCPFRGCTGVVGQNLTAVWKYNMAEHVKTAHPGFSYNGIERGAHHDEFLQIAHISNEEEMRIGIPANKIPPKIDVTTLQPGAANTNNKRQVAAVPTLAALRSSKRARLN